MNKQELIKIYENTSCTLISINGVLEDLRQLDEPQSMKLKDVIARIKKLDLGSQELWLNEILNKLGSDYGSLKYRAGYEQGKFDCAMERDKVTVPQFVADWYEANKDDFETNLFRAVDLIPSDYEEGDLSEFEEWLVDNHTEPFQTLVNMHQFGYVVKKERRYTVKMRTTKQPLFYNNMYEKTFFSLGDLATRFTCEELEKLGLGWAFDCPGIEVEEVEE
jgi:hypothetical protein